MNKKYIVGGLIFWAGVSGYMGLRILESYTEDAVFAALSAVPAQAQEIRYSFLSNTLTLKGVEYELPDDRIMHKGTIESVEVKGFNRKCMFVKPDMPPYDPDALPIVAESITATGITDSVHVGHTKAEQKVDSVQLTGWYQRLGMLLDQRSQHGGKASYFEELYRCRLDGLEISNVKTLISEADQPSMNFGIARIALAEGIRAPRGGEKVSPVSLTVSGIQVGGKYFSGALQGFTVSRARAPEPAVLEEILRLTSDTLGADRKNVYGSPLEEIITQISALMQKNYENSLPFSRISLQGGDLKAVQRVTANGNMQENFFSASLKGFDCALAMPQEGAIKNTITLSGLKIGIPQNMGLGIPAVLERYTPGGFTINASSESVTSDTEMSGRALYELVGLGSLECELDLLGDMRALQTVMVDGDPSGSAEELMQSIRLKKLNVVYKDSGLLPMGVEVMARWHFDEPESLLAEIFATLKMFGQSPERPVQELCTALTEQFTMPGEFRMTMAPQQPVNAAEILALASADPDALPVSFSSKPGAKALKDYLPGGQK